MPVDILSETPEELAKKVYSRWAAVDLMQALVYDLEQAHFLLDEVGVPRPIALPEIVVDEISPSPSLSLEGEGQTETEEVGE